MSEKGNRGPAIPRFSEMFRFADDSDLNEHVRELRAEAIAYGFNLDLRVFPGAIPPSKKAELAAGITPLPKRAREILYELITKHYLNLCEAVNAERRRRGQKPTGDAVKLAKFKADFDQAYYGKLRHSEKARRIVDLLRAWYGRQIIEQWNKAEGEQLENRIRLVLLSPFLNAVRVLDTDFLKLLAQAANMLSRRIYSSKDKTIGIGDTYLDLWLLQYGLRIAGTPTHTARELNEQFVSKFRSIADKKLREKCRELGVPLKDDVRGAGSVRRKRANVPRDAAKKG